MTKRTVELELATPGLDAQGRPVRVPLAVTDTDASPTEPHLAGEHMLINIGPQHPATHGVLRLVVELDGETVVRVIPHVGYLHSGFEKLGEYRHYNQIIPLTDRTDYLSPMANNVGFALAAEKLMGIEITRRCTVLRVIACEMSRIISHMVWLGTTSIDLGAFTSFLWAFQERERIYDLQEMWTGARLTTSVTRVGGLMADVPDRFVEKLREFTQTFPKTLGEIDRVLTRNAVWVGRTQTARSEEHTSELQSRGHLVCRLLLEKKKIERSADPRHHGPSRGEPRRGCRIARRASRRAGADLARQQPRRPSRPPVRVGAAPTRPAR